MFDVQPAQEGQYYCVASNGWYNVTSQVVSVTIMCEYSSFFPALAEGPETFDTFVGSLGGFKGVT